MSILREDQIQQAICVAIETLGHAPPKQVVLQKIPFSGMWGWGTPVSFQLASAERKQGQNVVVNERAQQIAEEIGRHLDATGKFHRVEAVKGYVNVFFAIGRVAENLLQSVQSGGANYGRGESISERVMIEYSQPNTHKSFHVGHLRNVCLGNALSRILEFAGFQTITANYPGDIGMHVIRCLWAYLKFHKGEKPATNRGRWLGEIYAHAAKILSDADTYRDRAVGFLFDLTHRRPEHPLDAETRATLSSRLFDRIERSVVAPDVDPELRKDLLKLLERGWSGQALAFNEFAHRAVGEWMWQLWTDFEAWLHDLEQQFSTDPERAEQIRKQLEVYRQIGKHPEKWGFAREVRDIFRRWEQRDPELIQLWEETRQWSLDDFNRIYAELDVHFDVWFYEHEVEDSGKDIVEDLIKSGVATDLRPSGPVLVHIDQQLDRDEPEYRTLIILRSDGTSLYSTKDLALAKMKFQNYQADRSIYVVDVGQALYFQQIFKVLELWGFEQASKCFHLAYEIVRLPSGKMSSREGSVVFFDDFYEEALLRARESVDSKRSEEQFSDLPELAEEKRQQVAQAVALGAMKYGMLSVDNNKPISFDFDKALSFEGQTAPYLQYAHARACRILEKAGGPPKQPPDYSHGQVETAEINLFEVLADFPNQVQRAAREYKPLYIAVYLYSLAKSFNDFYRDCPVLKAPAAIRDNRLLTVDATRQVLANGLRLLGIPAPDYM